MTTTDATRADNKLPELVAELLEKLEADPKDSAIEDPKYLSALALLKSDNELRYDGVLTQIVLKTKRSKRVLNKSVEKYLPQIDGEIPTPPTPPTEDEFTEDVRAVGDNILRRGKVLKFLLQRFHKYPHIGDDIAGRILFLSYASGSSRRGNGIQPGLFGDAQIGKSDACDAAMHNVPKKWIKRTGLSDKSVYYMELAPGFIIYSDDIVWGDGLIYVLKTSMSSFRTGSDYTTVLKVKGEMQSVQLYVPPRLLWWITSADGAPNDQIESRQYPVPIEQDIAHAAKVSRQIFKSRAKRKPAGEADRGTMIARYILNRIREDGPFDVEIPYSGYIEYKNVKDYRGQKQFLDLIDALAILNYQQRETKETKEGCIVATLEDFREAERIFNSHREAHNSGLTKAELEIVEAIALMDVHTQDEIAETLGISQGLVSRRIKTIMGKGSWITADFIDGRYTYNISKTFDLGKVFGNVVRLGRMPTNRVFIPAL